MLSNAFLVDEVELNRWPLMVWSEGACQCMVSKLPLTEMVRGVGGGVGAGEGVEVGVGDHLLGHDVDGGLLLPLPARRVRRAQLPPVLRPRRAPRRVPVRRPAAAICSSSKRILTADRSMAAQARTSMDHLPERTTAREDAATRRPMAARADTIAGTP